MSESNFLSVLGENMRSSTQNTLLVTVVTDPDRTIGDILDSLDSDPQTAYLVDTFKSLTIGDILGTASNIMAMVEGHQAAQGSPAAATVVAKPAASNGRGNGKPKVARPKGPKAKPPKAKAPKAKPPKVKPPKVGKDDGHLDLSNPDMQKAYEASVVKFLRVSKANDEETALSSAAIRDVCGGSADQARKVLTALCLAEKCSYTGKARGTRYYLL